MKNIHIIFILLVSFLFSCSNDLEDLNETDNKESTQREFVELKNGIKLHKFDDDNYIFQGDILLSKEQAENLVKFSDLPFFETRGSIASESSSIKYWSNGVIPYTLPNNIPDNLRTNLLAAMRQWESNTSIRFVPKTSSHSKYVPITILDDADDAAGYSSIGCSSKQTFKVKANVSIASCLHELGHTIGLVHEHERNDRYDHIVLHTNEMNPEFEYAFHPGNYSIKSIHPFDFRSIMIYNSYAFSIGSNPTITTVDGDIFFRSGNLSIYDTEIVKHMYENIYYNIVLQIKGNIRNRIEYTITYPQSVKKEDNVIITVKAKVTSGSPESIVNFNFYNPSNGYLVSSNNNVETGNSNIKIQEFVFRPNTSGQLKIYTSEMINESNYITITVR